MKIRIKDTGKIIGEVATNQSLDIYAACELAGIDAGHSEVNEYDIDDLVMDYDTKNEAASAFGRLGGSVKSAAKTAAARENAKKGGWPKGRKRKAD